MKQKKELITVLVGILIIFNVFNLIIILTTAEQIVGDITGDATGTASLCVGQQPQLSTINDQSATAGESFTLQVNASNTDNASYTDNTSLFDINQSGSITFTPSSGQVGNHNISITVSNNYECIQINSSQTFALSIDAGTEEEESLVPAPATGDSGGGGGSALPEEKKPESSFVIVPSTIKTTIKENRDTTLQAVIENTGESILEIVISSTASFISIAPTSFTLTPGQKQVITITLNAPRGIYTSRIMVAGDGIIKYLPLIVQVESDLVTIDIDELELELVKLPPGATSLKALMTFKGTQDHEKATLIYSILDPDGKEHYAEQEDISLEGIVSFSKELRFGQLPEGRYILAIKIMVGNSFATTIKEFIIGNPEGLGALAGSAYAIGESKTVVGFAISVMTLFIIMILVTLYLLHRRTLRHHTIRQKTIIKTVDRPSPAIDHAKLKEKLAVLEEGYRQGYIKNKAYQDGRQKIMELLKR